MQGYAANGVKPGFVERRSKSENMFETRLTTVYTSTKALRQPDLKIHIVHIVDSGTDTPLLSISRSKVCSKLNMGGPSRSATARARFVWSCSPKKRQKTHESKFTGGKRHARCRSSHRLEAPSDRRASGEHREPNMSEPRSAEQLREFAQDFVPRGQGSHQSHSSVESLHSAADGCR